jgi:hypothetical protein
MASTSVTDSLEREANDGHVIVIATGKVTGTRLMSMAEVAEAAKKEKAGQASKAARV